MHKSNIEHRNCDIVNKQIKNQKRSFEESNHHKLKQKLNLDGR